MIIVASLALGHALLATGAAGYIAQLFVLATKGLPVAVILSGLMLLMAVMTNVVSNNAAAVIGTPISISIAQQIGAPDRAVYSRGYFWRQHELCHTDWLPDQPAHHERRRLQVY